MLFEDGRKSNGIETMVSYFTSSEAMLKYGRVRMPSRWQRHNFEKRARQRLESSLRSLEERIDHRESSEKFDQRSAGISRSSKSIFKLKNRMEFIFFICIVVERGRHRVSDVNEILHALLFSLFSVEEWATDGRKPVSEPHSQMDEVGCESRKSIS